MSRDMWLHGLVSNCFDVAGYVMAWFCESLLHVDFAGEEGGKEREKESKSRSSSPDTNMVASAVPMATLPASMTTVAANEVRPAVSEDIEKKQGVCGDGFGSFDLGSVIMLYLDWVLCFNYAVISIVPTSLLYCREKHLNRGDESTELGE